MGLKIALDCRHFIGDRPCTFKMKCICENYSPMGKRILIIKLGALGDVVRTLSLLPSLKKVYPKSHISWVSLPNGVRILKGHPLIDQLFAYDSPGITALQAQEFDLIISLDKEPEPAGLCNILKAKEKKGICLSKWGTPQPTDPKVEPYFELGLDDDLKFFKNKKTYPELIHEALDVPYRREPYRLYPDKQAKEKAQRIFSSFTQSKRAVVGLNTGAGNVFACKAPSKEKWVEIAKELLNLGYLVALYGGPYEKELNQWINKACDNQLLDTGTDNTEMEFVALVGLSDVFVTGDTLGLHVAISQGVPTVALFGPTCAQEIDLFDNGVKLVTPAECAPCYKRSCQKNPNCMDIISSREIVQAVVNLLPKSCTV
ncbi:MAG TPA: glycosyltransferase family 9 protein [Bacteroidetes bacterium]|nr:glycosyltransferase family 9 protein [Bacteroidota bacterium]